MLYIHENSLVVVKPNSHLAQSAVIWLPLQEIQDWFATPRNVLITDCRISRAYAHLATRSIYADSSAYFDLPVLELESATTRTLHIAPDSLNEIIADKDLFTANLLDGGEYHKVRVEHPDLMGCANIWVRKHALNEALRALRTKSYNIAGVITEVLPPCEYIVDANVVNTRHIALVLEQEFPEANPALYLEVGNTSIYIQMQTVLTVSNLG